MIGDVLWSPPSDFREISEIGRFMTWLESERNLRFSDYADLYTWSIADLEAFWGAVVDFYGVRFHDPYVRVLADEAMPGARWFPGATLNYAEHMLGTPEDHDRVAVISHSQTRESQQLTFGELREQVARVRAGLVALGVGRGDSVAAYLPNIPETLIAYIATASLGATWSACAIEFGPRSVIDRFRQTEPSVLLVASGYGFRDRYIDRTGELAAIREGLPCVQHVVGVRYGSAVLPAGAVTWETLSSCEGPLEFEAVPFEHPLFVLFSSGTTGPPKAIIHSHGGQLIEHLKHQGLIWDLKPGARMMWFATTAWMMWNALVSALLLRACVVLLDGDPTWPDLMNQWRLADELEVTNLGLSPVYAFACKQAGLLPGCELELRSLRVVHVGGAPVPGETYQWMYRHLNPEVLFANGTGGTDVCTGFAEACFATPVYEGEISAPCLGVELQALDAHGQQVAGEFGEMVVAKPMPSMPVGFCGDSAGERFRAAYFEAFPGLWSQGDWIRFTPRGSCVIGGRSDATLNRGGVRLGTSEFYAVLEELPEVKDSLVLHLEDDDGGAGRLLVFVVPAEGTALSSELEREITSALRSQLSPRHAPDAVIEVSAIPRTLTGKKLETPIKRILLGEAPDRVASGGSLLDPNALGEFETLARTHPWRVSSRG